MSKLHAILGLATLVLSPALTQGQMLVTSGYSVPAVHAAPGQVTSLFVDGLGSLPKVTASTLPLPTRLAGISVFLELPGRGRLSVPIFAVEPAAHLVAVTVQIPFELPVPSRIGPPGPLPGGAFLVIERGTVPGPPTPVVAWDDRVHVLTQCDQDPWRFLDQFDLPFFPCRPVVTHADGSPVMPERPAKPGESLVMYAFGLGHPITPVPTGTAPAQPVPLDPGRWLIDVEFRVNAPPRVPLVQPGPLPRPRPLYVGLVPGFVGLYQINFQVPVEVPREVPRCEGAVFSNLTISIAGRTRFVDGAAICVDPGASAQ